MKRTLPLCFFILLLCGAAAAQNVRLRVLATTDLHGNILPYDYFTAKPAERGLAKIATLIARERAAEPNTLLVDCGDTIQGSPLETVHQVAVRNGKNEPDPMMLAMNKLGYAAMAVGNHEFNYGLTNLNAARKTAKFPWLSANTQGWSGVEPYILKTVAGVRVGIIGLTTEVIPAWEKPENYPGVRFLSGLASAKKYAAELRDRQKADVVILIAHSGLDRNVTTGALLSQDLPGENIAYQLATDVPGVDAVIFGHSHQELPTATVNGVLMMQPRNWGISLGELDLNLERKSGRWQVASKTSRTLPVTKDIPADESILAMAKPYHAAAEQYLDKPVTDVPVELSAATGRIEDNALIDAIQQVQMEATGAPVSFASAFNLSVRVPAGKMTVRQLAALYPYDNTLYALEGTGRTVREALENSVRFFHDCIGDCSQAQLINTQVFGFNYDIAQGVDYTIDLSRPLGQRIVDLKFQGKPLSDDQPLKIAVNSYRAGGSGGYGMFKSAKIVYRSSDEIREMMIRHFTEKGRFPSAADGNWRIVPEVAFKRLRSDALREGPRAPLQ